MKGDVAGAEHGKGEQLTSRRGLIENVARLVALSAALLPVVGYLSRVSYLWAAGPDPWGVAGQASLADLAATGFQAVLPGVAGALSLLAVMRTTERQATLSQRMRGFEEASAALSKDMDAIEENYRELFRDAVTGGVRPELTTRAESIARGVQSIRSAHGALSADADELVEESRRLTNALRPLSRLVSGRTGIVFTSALVTGTLALLFFAPGFPANWLTIPPSILIFVVGSVSIARTGRLALAPTGLALLVALAMVAIVDGLGGGGPGVTAVDATFTADSHIKNGLYEEVGIADGLVYLVPCDGTGPSWVAINLQSVATLRSDRGSYPAPSLADIVLHGQTPRLPVGGICPSH